MENAIFLFHIPFIWDPYGSNWARILWFRQQYNVDVGENLLSNILYVYSVENIQLIRNFAMDEGIHFVLFLQM